MTATGRQPLRQRADYTHKYNLHTGRHGWLRLTPAYSVKIVEELIEKCDRPMRILDPFCGTATTALSAAYHGHEGVTTDINPFLVWLGQAKTAYYSAQVISATRDTTLHVLKLVEGGDVEPISPPPIHNISRWWAESSLRFLCRLRASIDTVGEADLQERTILLVAFCRTLIRLSNAAFNHQSMSFKGTEEQLAIPFAADMSNQYSEDVRFVLSGAAVNPEGVGEVMLADARTLNAVMDRKFDCVITSPPYANRMSYIRELRPYMYWLGFLSTGRDAGELDWASIGGTWGIATSRLIDWEAKTELFETHLLNIALQHIAHHDNKNGRILANYIAKYFEDIWMHFQNLRLILKDGAEVHYIVGNSSFYGVLLPVEQIYAEMLASLGFQSITCLPIRKRNSKRELVEFDVTAIWKS
jgi:hypothetical protein